MNAGELVVHYFDEGYVGIGLVIKEVYWEDEGSMGRNVGVDVFVLWGDGTVSNHFEDELSYAVDNHENW